MLWNDIWRVAKNMKDKSKGPAIFNSGYPGGANMGGVRQILTIFDGARKNFATILWGTK